MVSQEGLKKKEVQCTASNMKKVNDRKTEKSTKRKAGDEKGSLEQKERQASENSADQNDPRNKDFWEYGRHFSIPTRNKTQGFLAKNPSPAVLQISQDLQPAEKSFSRVLLNSCDKSSSINPFPVSESSLHQKESGTLQFSKRRRLSGFFEMENQTYEQVSSTETSAQIQFSGQSTPKEINHLESLQPRQQEIIGESFKSKHLTQSFSQMRLNMSPGEQKKMILTTDGSKILDSSELKDVSSEATKLNGIESKNCVGEITHSNDFKKQIRKLSVIDSIGAENDAKTISSLIQIKHGQAEKYTEKIKDVNIVGYKNCVIQDDRESDEKNVSKERFHNLSCSPENLKNKNGYNKNPISSAKTEKLLLIDQSYYLNQNKAKKKPSLLQKPKIKELERCLLTAKKSNLVFSQENNNCHQYQKGNDRINFDQSDTQALKKLNTPESSSENHSPQFCYSVTNQRAPNVSKIQVQQPLNQVNTPSSRENFHATNFDLRKDSENKNWKISEGPKMIFASKGKNNRESRIKDNFYSKTMRKERISYQSIDGNHNVENSKKKKTKGSDWKANEQNGPHFMDLSRNNYASVNDSENFRQTVNALSSKNFSVDKTKLNKNTNDFKFSAPIYHDVDPTQSDFETSFDSSNNSEDIPSIENCEISNSAIFSNYHIFKTYLASCGLPEPFSSPNSSTNIEIINHSQAYGCATSENRSEADVENRSHTKECERTCSSSSRSVLSEQSSCDSCLESSSSADDDEDSMLVSSEHS